MNLRGGKKHWGRVLLAKPGLDGHDRGVKIVARGLRDAGMEVVYLGLRSQAPMIAKAASEEDVDIVGLSFLSGAHMGFTREVLHQLAAAGVGDIPIVVGGTIPARDVATLEALGVAAVFRAGAPLDDIVETIQELIRSGRKSSPETKDR